MLAENDCKGSFMMFKDITNYHNPREYFEPELGEDVPCPFCGEELTVEAAPHTRSLKMLPRHQGG